MAVIRGCSELGSSIISPEEISLRLIYQAFNVRELDTILSLLHPDVHWPNGWEGGWIEGREAVRQYWLRQWSSIDPRVIPIAFTPREDGSIIVTVHQVVRDLSGTLLSDRAVSHTYTFRGRLIESMVIGETEQKGGVHGRL